MGTPPRRVMSLALLVAMLAASLVGPQAEAQGVSVAMSSEKAAEATTDDAPPTRAEGFRDSVTFEYIQIISVAFIIVFGFIRPFLIEPYKIPSGSMENTLFPGDRVLVVKFLYGVKLPGTSRRLFSFRPPRRGDVFVFSPKHQQETHFIKRITAIGGDTVSTDGKTLVLNGERVEDEPYAKHVRGAGAFPPFRRLVPYYWEAPGVRESVEPFGTRTEVTVQLAASGEPNAITLDDRVYSVRIARRDKERAREIPVREYYHVRADSDRRNRDGILYQNTNSSQWYFTESLTRSAYRARHPGKASFTVPDRHLFAMGDNRGNSEDSRVWGPVPFDVVKGKAVLVYWSTDPRSRPWNLFKWLRVKRVGMRIRTQHGAVDR
jgi:signal peptidase I